MNSEYMLSKNQESKYLEFNVNALKSRGWTRRMIKKYLGEPDRHDTGRGTRGHLMSLYKKMRVLEAEAQEACKKDIEIAKQKREARSAAGKKSWATKVKAREDLENKFWDVSGFTPENVREIYNGQRKKDPPTFPWVPYPVEYSPVNPGEPYESYPEYEQATTQEVADMLYTYKRDSVSGLLDISWRRPYIRAKILKHISGKVPKPPDGYSYD